jgi:hypothetical protein
MVDTEQLTQPDAALATTPPPPPSPPSIDTMPPAPSSPKRSIVDRFGGRRRILVVLGVVVLLVGALAIGSASGSASAKDAADKRIATANEVAAAQAADARSEAGQKVSAAEARTADAEAERDDAVKARKSAETRANAQMERRLKAARAEDAAKLERRKADQDTAAKQRSGALDTRQAQLDQRQKDLDAKSADISGREAAVSQQETQSVGDGIYEVGKDMAPGKYHTNSPDEYGCYYALLSAPSDAGFDNIIDNNNVDGPATIVVNSPYFESNGCGTWQKVG